MSEKDESKLEHIAAGIEELSATSSELKMFFKQFMDHMAEQLGDIMSAIDSVKADITKLGQIPDAFGESAKLLEKVQKTLSEEGVPAGQAGGADLSGFESRIEELDSRLGGIEGDVKSISNAVTALGKATAEVINKLSGISEKAAVSTASAPEPAPTPAVSPRPPKPSKAVSQATEPARVKIGTSTGPVADILDALEADIQSGKTAEDLAKSFEDSRDQLMKHISYHPAYFEMGKVIKALTKYGDSPLDKNSTKQLIEKIETWRERMRT
ncbi:MAG: hypothetical protein ACFFBS_05060 [Promethearchaeota archaeon]